MLLTAIKFEFGKINLKIGTHITYLEVEDGSRSHALDGKDAYKKW